MSQLHRDKATSLYTRRGVEAEGRRAIDGPPPRPGDWQPPALTSDVARDCTIKHTRTAVGSPDRGPSMARLPARATAAGAGCGFNPVAGDIR